MFRGQSLPGRPPHGIAQVGPQGPPAPVASLRAKGAPLRGRVPPMVYLDNPKLVANVRHQTPTSANNYGFSAAPPPKPVARDVAVTPPRPSARTSLAANRRRPRSSRNGAANCHRNRISSTLITGSGYRQATVSHQPSSRF